MLSKRIRLIRQFLRSGLLVLTALLLPLGAVLAETTDGSLPGGTPISVSINTDATVLQSGGNLNVSGTAVVDSPSQPSTTVIYVLDVSGSTVDDAGTNPGCGDFNGDTKPGTTLDCELLAIKNLNDKAISLGTIQQVGIVAFGSLNPNLNTHSLPAAVHADMDGATGDQLLVNPDAQTNAVKDVDAVLKSIIYGNNPAVRAFSQKQIEYGNTNYSAGLIEATNLLNASNSTRKLVVFLSDGYPNDGTNVNNFNYSTLNGKKIPFYTFAVGSGSSCNTNNSLGTLQDIARNTGATCTNVSNISNLPNVLPSVISSQLTGITLTQSFNNGSPVSLSPDLSASLPVAGGNTVSYSATLQNLSAGSYKFCTTATGQDGPTGQQRSGSVAACSEVNVYDPPTIVLTGGLGTSANPYTVAEGGSVLLDGSGSTTQAAGGLTFSWDLDNDGAYETSTGTIPTLSFSAANLDGPSDSRVGLKVCDSNNFCSATIIYIHVTNVAPTASIIGIPASSPEGTSISLSGSAADPGSADTAAGFTFAWSVTKNGNSFASGSGSSCSFTPDDNGAYLVSLTATDKDGGTSVPVTANINVSNLAPTVHTPVVSPEPSIKGNLVGATATFSDPGTNDAPFTCKVDWGDGSVQDSGSVSGTNCASPNHVYANAGSYSVTFYVTDKDGSTGQASTSHVVKNPVPVVGTPVVGPEPSIEGSAVNATATFNGPDTSDGPFSCKVDWGDGSAQDSGTVSGTSCTSPNHIYRDNGSYSVTFYVTNKYSITGQASVMHQVNNVAPSVGVITPSLSGPNPVGTVLNFSASFSDPGVLDTHTASWDWGDGTISTGTVTESGGSGKVSNSHAYSAVGVYVVKLTVTDKDGASGASTYQYVVVFDPNAGFVTGGGSINSPAGALVANPTTTGKATFGFVAKYHKGATVPGGNTEFQFQAGNFKFSSTSYDWLVIAGAKAQYKGSGTINGQGDFAFTLTATDGDLPGGGGVDKFRIKIWNKATNAVIYDNQLGAGDSADPTTAISNGSIVIHQ